MQITFLVGNGFDIASGIDTSYGAFYEWYCSQESNVKHINDFRKDIKKDIKEGGKNWADFELGLGQYTRHFTVDNVNKFFECYEDAHEKIIEFLEEQKLQYNLEDFTEEEIEQFADGILNFYQDLFPQEIKVFEEMFSSDKGNNTVVNFLSFNYTDTLNTIIKHVSKKPLKEWEHNRSRIRFSVNSNIIHMHGTSAQYPILGVNDETQIANQDLLSVPNFSKIMIKPESVNAIGQLWHSEAEEMISKSRVICVFGMSLGESDSKWWSRILRWLKENSNRHLIIYWYTKTPPNGISVFRELEQQRFVKQIMYKYIDFSESEIANMDSRIHIILNTRNVLSFNLKKVDSNSTKELVDDQTIILAGGEIRTDTNSFANYDGVGREIVVV